MKVVGSVIILISSVISSYIYERHRKEEITDLKELLKLCHYIKNQILYFSYPLKEIYKNYKTENKFIISLINGDDYFIFDNDIRNKIHSCFVNLGKGYKNEQINSLDCLITEIERTKEQAESVISQKTRVFRSVSFFVGCCVIILLV